MEYTAMITFVTVTSTVSVSYLPFLVISCIMFYAHTLPSNALWIGSQFKILMLSYSDTWIFRLWVVRVYWYLFLTEKVLIWNLETSLKWATDCKNREYNLRMTNSIFILNWKALQKHAKVKQNNNLISIQWCAHCIKALIKYSFYSQQESLHAFAWILFPFGL